MADEKNGIVLKRKLMGVKKVYQTPTGKRAGLTTQSSQPVIAPARKPINKTASLKVLADMGISDKSVQETILANLKSEKQGSSIIYERGELLAAAQTVIAITGMAVDDRADVDDIDSEDDDFGDDPEVEGSEDE